ncbi:MAG: hypothetical protein M1838_005705 [Thelocarpon superellum]|nr:MAG: hypothetical protein M1838_005705 [Thelocarpon superellum]
MASPRPQDHASEDTRLQPLPPEHPLKELYEEMVQTRVSRRLEWESYKAMLGPEANNPANYDVQMWGQEEKVANNAMAELQSQILKAEMQLPAGLLGLPSDRHWFQKMNASASRSASPPQVVIDRSTDGYDESGNGDSVRDEGVHGDLDIIPSLAHWTSDDERDFQDAEAERERQRQEAAAMWSEVQSNATVLPRPPTPRQDNHVTNRPAEPGFVL